MTFEALRESIPAQYKDARLNLAAVLDPEQSGLSVNTVAFVALATAYATRSKELLEAALSHAEGKLDDAARSSAEVTASLMAMNNVYYRFTHLAGHPGLEELPARLRMNHMARPGVEKVDFELASLSISALAGCGKCISSHVRELEKAGVKLESIQWSARLAAVFASVAQALASR
jgi:alkyl hydroperoxide reductase subunit D